MQNFTRLVRFEDQNGQIHYGEAGDQWEKSLHGHTLPTFDGDPLAGSLEISGKTAKVAKVRLLLQWAKFTAKWMLITSDAGFVSTSIGSNHLRHWSKLQETRRRDRSRVLVALLSNVFKQLDQWADEKKVSATVSSIGFHQAQW